MNERPVRNCLGLFWIFAGGIFAFIGVYSLVFTDDPSMWWLVYIVIYGLGAILFGSAMVLRNGQRGWTTRITRTDLREIVMNKRASTGEHAARQLFAVGVVSGVRDQQVIQTFLFAA